MEGIGCDTHPGRSLRFITGSHAMAVNDVLQLGAWNHVVAVFEAAADLILKGMDGAINARTVICDFARLMDGAKEVKCSEFGSADS